MKAYITTIEPCVTDILADIQADDHGAVALFVGTVRNHHNGRVVTGITYDAHKILGEKALREICEEAQRTWPGTRYHVAHYRGELPVGGVSVVIAVGAAHRTGVFEACSYVIEEIKKRVPVWKQEHYLEGKSEWLPGYSLKNAADGFEQYLTHEGARQHA